MNEVRDNLLVDDFVSPSLAELIWKQGVIAPFLFTWVKLKNGDYFLNSYLFDTHNVYRDSDPMVLKAITGSDVDERFPAITPGMLTKALPNFFVSKVNREYEVALEGYPEIPVFCERKLSDAMARLMLDMIQKRLINPMHVAKMMRI